MSTVTPDVLTDIAGWSIMVPNLAMGERRTTMLPQLVYNIGCSVLLSWLLLGCLGLAPSAAQPPDTPVPRIEAGMHTAPIIRIDVDAAERFLVTASTTKRRGYGTWPMASCSRSCARRLARVMKASSLRWPFLRTAPRWQQGVDWLRVGRCTFGLPLRARQWPVAGAAHPWLAQCDQSPRLLAGRTLPGGSLRGQKRRPCLRHP